MGIELRTARTLEIDETEDAINEIIEGLDIATLKANSAGIIYCNIDFVDSGIIEGLQERLGFDAIGMTTGASATEEGFSIYGLNVAVLTSDDVSFKAGTTYTLSAENYEVPIQETYKELRATIGRDPALSILFSPSTLWLAGGEVVRVFDAVCGGIPFWGSISTGVELMDPLCRTFYNGQILEDALVMLLVDGDVKPEFYIESLPKLNISERRAVITKAERYRIHEINDTPVVDWLNSFGLNVTPDNLPATNPLLQYYKGSSEAVTLGFYALTDDGATVMGGLIEEGSVVTLGNVTSDGIIETAHDCLALVEQSKHKDAVLFGPCVTRFFALSPDMTAEMDLVDKQFGASGTPFILGYSSGEFCPAKDIEGKYINRFHNYTFTACVL